MSDIIHLLPDSVANQIAAGEVIQRPASVIKELVENAIDAGATTIHVIVTDAGRTCIQVIDNGKGMSETDARMAFERHATSKITVADDLFNLHTMGFRGEALASIAAVAQVELRTRKETSEVGTLLSMAASKVVCQEPVSCPVGTNFKVENLFYNVPARRKFLKSNATELSNIVAAMERIVLVYPQITFTLHSNDNELMNLRTGNTHQRIVELFGKRINQDLLPVKVDTTLCRITGFVGKPEAARKRGTHQYFFVNGRYMKHPYFHKAVMNAYERLVPAGMLVPYFLYFEVSPMDIDVNIHPTKTEIKFENEQPIWQILTAAVKDAIGSFCEVSSIDFDTEGKPDIPVYNPEETIDFPKTAFNPVYNPFQSASPRAASNARHWSELYEDAQRDSRPASPRLFDEVEDMEEETSGLIPSKMSLDLGREPSADLAEGKSPVHYQYKGRFIMTAVKSGLMIIDQQRADVRIRYERYLDTSRPLRSQQVLFPEVVHFPPSDAVLMQKVLPELATLGFELTDLGQNSYAVNGVPTGIEGLNPVRLLTDMVAMTVEQGSASVDDIHHHLALGLARNAAVPLGQVLDNQEMEDLVNRLFACKNVNYTPDGKKIIHILQQADIERFLD